MTTGSFFSELKQSIAAQLPSRQDLERSRFLRPIAHRLAARELWRLKPESLARGAALGVFWAFAVPVAQILFAALHCVFWRGNIPVAAAATLITNPLTVGPWLLLAYQIGSLFVTPTAPPLAEAAGWLDKLGSLGAPTLLGMAILAVGGAALAYVVVRLGAQAHLAWRLRQRAAARGARA